MTTHHNHNTADQSGAMQPASSASSADLAALFKELSNCYVIRYGRKTTIELPYDLYDRILAATRNESAIVPQVVQAPIPYSEITIILNEVMELAGKNGANSVSMPEEYVAVAHFLCYPHEYAAPIASNELSGNSGQLTAPIVATVPSDLRDWDRISKAAATACNEYGQWMPERWLQLFVAAYNAAPSPTEQASDARNLDMEKLCAAIMLEVEGNIRPTIRDCVNGADDVQDIYGYCNEIESIIENALKSAPAAKGNAQDEAKNIDYSIKRGDVVTNDRWTLSELIVEDVNWALSAVALRLGKEGGLVVWPATGLKKVGQA